MASVSNTDFDSSGTNATTYNFTSTIGAGDGTRTLFFAIFGRQNDAGAGGVASVTVDTVGASSVVAHTITEAANVKNTAAIYKIAASALGSPTATSVTVSVTFTSPQLRACCSAYVTADAIEAAAFATSTAGTTGTPADPFDINLNLNVPANGIGIAIAGAGSSGTGAASYTWAGFTEDRDSDVGAEAARVSSASASNLSAATPLTVTATVSDTGAATTFSPIGVAASFAPADVTAPVLSNPTATATGETTADIGVDTDEGAGTLSWVVTTSASAPSGAQVAAGQDHTGAAADASGSQAVSGTGTQSANASGLTAGTTYWAHFVQDDAAANRSDVASSASFETDAAPVQDIAIGIGAGSLWRQRLVQEDENRDKRWKRRRQQIEKISRSIEGIEEAIPSDVPEAQIVREAAQAVEKAADKLVEDVPAPVFDYAGLARLAQRAEAAVRQAEDALARYEARRRRELEEQDDEDVLLLM
jgi:hypothetical protein